jgi:tetratricopeptide (TPR) repeat protein
MIRTLLVAAFAAMLPSLVFAQRAQGFNPNTPDGKMVDSIQKTTDPAQKQALLEQFVKAFPTSAQAGWAWAQLQDAYLKAQQYDKVLEAGQKSLAADPDDTAVAYNNLKAAEATNDAAGVMKWSAETSKAARKEIASFRPGADDQSRLDYAKQVDTYTEYSVYAAAAKTTDPAQIVALIDSLQQRAPQSPYLSKAYGRYLNALQQTGQGDKAEAQAEQQLQRDPNNEDVLAFAASHNLQKNDAEKTLAYSSKLVELMQSKAKPADISDADWAKKKDTMLGLGYWMEGVSHNSRHQYADADKSLRAALPLVKENTQLLPIVLFHLGVADFELGKAAKTRTAGRAMMRDALKFSQQSAALKSPMQAEAANNVKAISRALGVAR